VSGRETAKWLKTVPLFTGCSARQLRQIAERGSEREYPSGKNLTEQGKPGDDFFVILEGQADVYRDGRKVRTLSPGDYFGEIALLSVLKRSPRTATITARTPLRCFLLSKSEFRGVIYEQSIAVNLLHTLAQRLPPDAGS
jgi:CRP/FNR family transcriptional regulator, cyclic AMP receptor protein